MDSPGVARKGPVLFGGLMMMATMLLAGCDDGPAQPVSSAPASSAPQAAVPGAEAQTAEGKQSELHLSAQDFVESETNRDPFRPYLSEFLTTQRRTAKIQRKVLLQRYGLDELQLIAVVAGGVRPVAMFRDPGGLGVTVKRGDYISKSAGKVKEILSDKVVVQIEEQLEDGRSMADRVIPLHPEGDAKGRRRR